jgi:hypothetical protein
MNCPSFPILLLLLDEEWIRPSSKVVPLIYELFCLHALLFAAFPRWRLGKTIKKGRSTNLWIVLLPCSPFCCFPRWRMSQIIKQGRPTNLWIVLPKCFPFLLLFLDEEWLGSSSKVVPLIYELFVHQFSHFLLLLHDEWIRSPRKVVPWFLNFSTTPYSLVLRKVYFDCPERDCHAGHNF